jgi:excisionase family DNA binding protein
MRLPLDTGFVRCATTDSGELVRNNDDVTGWMPSNFELSIDTSRESRDHGESSEELDTSWNIYDERLPLMDAKNCPDVVDRFDEMDRPLDSLGQLLFTVVEVTRILKLSRTKVYELLYAGQLASVKIGASRRVRKADLETFVKNLELAD